MTDVQVTAEDAAMANAWALDAQSLLQLAKDFAAYRVQCEQRAVEGERKRVIRIIEAKQRQYAEAAERSGFQTWRAAADAMLHFARELADQLEKGAG